MRSRAGRFGLVPSTTLSPSVRRGYALGLMSTLHRPLRGEACRTIPTNRAPWPKRRVVPTPPLPSPHEHPPRRLAATHAVAALTPLPTALQLASKDDAAYSLDSPANVSRLRLRLAHGMVRWYLTTAAAFVASHTRSAPCLITPWLSTVSEASETSRAPWRSNYAVVRPSETRIAACSP